MQLTKGEETLLISEGDCKRFNAELLCYEEKASSTTVRLSLTDLSALIEPELLFESDTYDAGDLVPVTIWYNNTGEREATNVRLTLPLPANVTVEDSNCDHNSTHLYWTGTISEQAEESCTFSLRINGKFDQKLQASITYETMGETKSDESKQVRLKGTIPFSYSITPSNFTDLAPGKPITINFLLNNTDKEENLSIEELLIEHDKFTTITDVDLPRSQTHTKSVTSKTDLEPKDGMTGSITLTIPYLETTGTIDIELTYTTSDDETERTIKKTIPYQTTTAQLLIATTPETLTIPSLSKGVISVTIENPNSYLTYKGYTTTIEAPFLEEPIKTSTPYERSRIVATIPYDFPKEGKQRSMTINVAVQATTIGGELVTAEQTFPITITPFNGPAIDKEQSSDAGITTVTVYATNHHQESIYATFQEQLPQGLFVRGQTTTTTTLPPGNKTKLYSYDYTAVDESFDATTTYTYLYEDTIINNETTTTITPLTQTTEEETPDPEPPQATPETNETTTTPAPQPVQRTTPSLLHVIVAASILLLIVAIAATRDFIKHFYHFGFRHKKLINDYKELLEHSESLRSKESVLKQEQERLSRQLDQLESHLGSYEEQLPGELSHLEDEQAKERKHEERLKALEAHLQAMLGRIQEKETQVKQHEQSLAEEEQHIRADEALLQQDDKTLKDEQERLHQLIAATIQEKERIAKKIAAFKETQRKHLDLSVAVLKKEQQHAQSYHKKLTREEEQLKEDFDKLKHDLQRSEQDLQRAEKIYKSSRTESS